MDSSLHEGLAAIRALRDEYDQVCERAIKSQARCEELEKYIVDKEQETSQLNKEIEHYDDQIVLLEGQLDAANATIDHYRQVKRSVSSDLERKKIDFDAASDALLKMKKQNETELLDWKKWQDDLIEELVADGIPIDDALLAQVNEEDSVDEEINSVERQIGQVDEETKQLKAELRDLEDQSGQREGVASTLEKLSLTIETKTRKIADMEKRANAKQFAVPRPPPTTAVAAATPNTMVQEPQPAEVDDTPVNTGGEEALENSVDYDLNVTAANVEEPGPSAQSTPMVMSSLSGSPSLKGLVSTNQVSKMMLASAVHQHVESPIPTRRLTAQSPEVVEVSNVHRQPMIQRSPQPMMQHSPHPQYRSPHRNEASPKYQGHQMLEEPPQFHRGPETMISPSRGSYEERSRPKIVTVQSPTFSVNNRSALVSPRSEESTSPVSTSAVLLRSPIMEEVEKEYQKMKKSSQSQEKDSGLGQEASNSGASFGGFGFGRGFGFSSTKEDSQEEDNNGFGFGGSGGGGFGFSF